MRSYEFLDFLLVPPKSISLITSPEIKNSRDGEPDMSDPLPLRIFIINSEPIITAITIKRVTAVLSGPL